MTADVPTASRVGVGAGAEVEVVMQDGGWRGKLHTYVCSVEEQKNYCVVRTTATAHVAKTEVT